MNPTPAPSQRQNYSYDVALHDATFHLRPDDQEEFVRVVKVLTQIRGFRLYFLEIDSLPYRDQLILELQNILKIKDIGSDQIDLSVQYQALSFGEFEDVLYQKERDSVVHILNSEVWLKSHFVEFNIRRNAIATNAQCALLWWLPKSSLELIAKNAPDVWSWRHGVFSFHKGEADTFSLPFMPLDQYKPIGNEGKFSGSLSQKTKRISALRQLLQQDMDEESRLQLLWELSDLLLITGHVNEAEDCLKSQILSLASLVLASLPVAVAVTMGKIADVLQRKGEIDEALRIRREELLPVYEKLGYVRERAITMGQIADVLQQKGEIDEALRIRREDELPVYEKLGDVRSRTITMGQIADVLQRKGEIDEAQRIRREEELPVYEKLGDVRNRAITMGQIADVLQQKGEIDEVLRIRREEQLPVFEKLGDVRSRAITMGQIADALQQKGEIEEALRIRREDELPVFERLGDVRSLLIAEVNLALNLAEGGLNANRIEIQRLLKKAYEQAKKMRLPQQTQIRDIYRSFFKVTLK